MAHFSISQIRSRRVTTASSLICLSLRLSRSRVPPPPKKSHSEDKLSEQGWAVSSKMERKTPHFMGYCLIAPGWRSLQQASGWSQGQGSSEWGREVGTQGMSVFMVSLGLLGEHRLPPLVLSWPGSMSLSPRQRASLPGRPSGSLLTQPAVPTSAEGDGELSL